MDALEQIIQQLIKFRNKLYEIIPKRRDAIFELIDALSTNIQADSVVQLSLNPHHRRSYNSIHDAVENFFYAIHVINKMWVPIRKANKR